MSITMMSFGVMPLGVLPITIAADSIGAPAAVTISSTVFLVVLVLAFVAVPRFRNLRLDAMQRAELSPVRAAMLVAEGKLSKAEADRLTGRTRLAPLPQGGVLGRSVEERLDLPEGTSTARPR